MTILTEHIACILLFTAQIKYQNNGQELTGHDASVLLSIENATWILN